MRTLRPLLAAAALGVIALGTTGANASAKPTIPPPPLPQPGQSAVDYLCNDLFPHYGVTADCADIECGPRSCDSIQGDRVR